MSPPLVLDDNIVKLNYSHKLFRIRRKRPELRIIVSSATMDANYFLDYFTSGSPSSSNEAVIVSLEGRMYPVQIAYADEPVPNFVERSAQVAWNIHMQVYLLPLDWEGGAHCDRTGWSRRYFDVSPWSGRYRDVFGGAGGEITLVRLLSFL